MADLATAFVGASAGVSCVSRSHGKFGGGAHRYVSGLPSVSWQIWRRRSSGVSGRFLRFTVSWQIRRRRSSLAGCRAFPGRFGDDVRRGVSCVSRSHGKFGGGAHRYVSGLPSVSWQIWRRRSSGRQRAFPAFHGLMANSAAALIGTLAGCRAFHGRFGDVVRRGVSGRFLRFTGRHFSGFIGASLQRFHCVSLGRHFSGFIAFHWGVTSAVSLRISRRLRNTSSRLWDGESTALALHENVLSCHLSDLQRSPTSFRDCLRASIT